MCRNLRSQVNKRCATGIRCLILLGIPLKRPNSGRLDCNRTCVSLNFEQKIFQCSEEGCSKKFSGRRVATYHPVKSSRGSSRAAIPAAPNRTTSEVTWSSFYPDQLVNLLELSSRATRLWGHNLSRTSISVQEKFGKVALGSVWPNDRIKSC